MSRRRVPRPIPTVSEPPVAVKVADDVRPIPRRTLALLVAFFLLGHYGLAAHSLIRENPTVDEVNHLPAGVSYWQTGSFRLYHHNPPLIKMIAALPILSDVKSFQPVFAQSPIWQQDSIPQAPFGAAFTWKFASRYFEIFTRARLLMPLFSVLGGLLVFVWSRQLFGDRGGLLSLACWCLCPNILAHGRLITSDVGAAVLGAAATYGFWRYLRNPGWMRAGIVGILLGIAQLSKFSMLLLYGLWPILWLVHSIPRFRFVTLVRTLLHASGQGFLIVILSVFVINLGYGFEGTGRRLGTYRFASQSILTKAGKTEGRSPNGLIDLAWKYRVNRFKGTWLGSIPAPLPKHYLLGFDEQKLEADGVPRIWADPRETDPEARTGYSVYLDGVLRRTGWRSYYIRSWFYKTPEGTILLVGLAVGGFLASRKARASWGDEFVLCFVPIVFFMAMTFLTDINIGLRYILPIYPYLFVFLGRLGKYTDSLEKSARRVVLFLLTLAVCATAVSTLMLHPHYLAYFNTLSGGPDREPPRLIDSNLDWGQDLIGLRDWMRDHPEEKRVGLVYFGQIPPTIFDARGEKFRWFLPPPRPGYMMAMTSNTSRMTGPETAIVPGLYAVSNTIRQGVAWRVYDPSLREMGGVWRAEDYAYDYFRSLQPFERIGHSISLFHVTQAQADRLNQQVFGR